MLEKIDMDTKLATTGQGLILKKPCAQNLDYKHICELTLFDFFYSSKCCIKAIFVYYLTDFLCRVLDQFVSRWEKKKNLQK